MGTAPQGHQKPPYSMLLTELRESGVIALTAGAATITIDFDKDYAHSFAGISYFDSAAADNPVLPTVGTETYTVETVTKPGIFQAVTGSPVNSVDQVDVGWDANATQVRVVLAAVDVATHVILRVSGNSA